MHVLNDMRRFGTLALAFAALAAGSGPVWAFRVPETNAPFPTPHQRALRYAETHPDQPYVMNYADEAAQNLGVKAGKWEAFSTHSSDPLMPSFGGGIDGGRLMFGLQWRR